MALGRRAGRQRQRRRVGVTSVFFLFFVVVTFHKLSDEWPRRSFLAVAAEFEGEQAGDIRSCTINDDGTCVNSDDHEEEGDESRSESYQTSKKEKVSNQDNDFPMDPASVFKFLNERVFGQKDVSGDHSQDDFLSVLEVDDTRDDESKEKKEQGRTNNNPFTTFLQGFSSPLLSWPNDDDDDDDENSNTTTTTTTLTDSTNRIVTQILERAAIMGQQEDVVEGVEYLKRLSKTFDRVVDQVNENFNDVLKGVDMSTPLAATYYAAHIDSIRNPTWKRRMHRFYDRLTKKELIQLYEGLYLSALAYAPTVKDFQDKLDKFQDGSFDLLHGSTRSLPNLPASFLLIHKQLAPLKEPSLKDFFFPKKESEVLVVLVVRGTKDVADLLADGLLAPTEYRGGLVHEGLLHAGKGIAEKYLPILKDVHEQSGRDKLKLVLVGHR
jgi:hypothetical protein